MLGYFRDNIKKFSIFLWIAVAAFVLGGAYLFVSGPFTMGGNTAVKVGKTKISMSEYEETYNNISNFYMRLLTQIKGGNVTDDDIKKLNIKQKTIDTLIERTLLLSEAKKEGIKVTDKDVENSVEENKAFYSNGQFSKDKYLAILKANNINPKNYEESIRISLYIDKLKKQILKGVSVSDQEVLDYYGKNYSKLNINYVFLPYKSFKKKVDLKETYLKKYYEQNKEKFRIPTKLKFQYVVIDLNYEKNRAKISDNETKKFYEQHSSYFTVPRRIKVAHILIEKKDNETQADFRKRAYKIYNELKDKKISFKDAAKKYSADKYTKKVGGDIGYITKNMVVKEFWDGVKDLKVSEMSKPFLSKFGYHIAKIEDIQKPYIRKFKDVKKEIRNYLKTQKAKENIFRDSKKIFVTIRDSKKDFKNVVEEFGLKAQESDYLDIKNVKPPFTKDMLKDGLLSGKNKLLGPSESKDGSYVIYEVSDRKASYIPDFNKIEDLIKKDYLEYKSKELAKEESQNIYKEALKSKNLNKVANKFHLKIYLLKGLTKFSPDAQMKCTYKESFMSTIFAKNKGYINKCSDNDGLYVYQISDKIIDKKDYKKQKSLIKSQLMAQKDQEAMENFINKLKKEVKIEVNPKL